MIMIKLAAVLLNLLQVVSFVYLISAFQKSGPRMWLLIATGLWGFVSLAFIEVVVSLCLSP